MCRRLSPRAALLFTVALLGAGCSGDDENTADVSRTTSTTTVTTSTTTTSTPATTTTTEPLPPPVEFEVLTYNVAGLPEALSGSEPETNTPLIGPLLNDYDLVLVQESWLTPDTPIAGRTYHEILIGASTHEFASTPLPAPLGSEPDRPTAVLSDGLNRFSDFAFDGDGVVRRRWTTCGEASADCLSLKGFSMARTTLPNGTEVDVYNLHMDAGREDAPVRGENVAELSAFIVAESAGRAVIVGGDFNLHLDRDPDADQFAELLETAGLTDACTSLACDDPDRIDKVLYRSGDDVQIEALEWRNDAPSFTRDDGEPLSDHDPVAVRLAISPG